MSFTHPTTRENIERLIILRPYADAAFNWGVISSIMDSKDTDAQNIAKKIISEKVNILGSYSMLDDAKLSAFYRFFDKDGTMMKSLYDHFFDGDGTSLPESFVIKCSLFPWGGDLYLKNTAYIVNWHAKATTEYRKFFPTFFSADRSKTFSFIASHCSPTKYSQAEAILTLLPPDQPYPELFAAIQEIHDLSFTLDSSTIRPLKKALSHTPGATNWLFAQLLENPEAPASTGAGSAAKATTGTRSLINNMQDLQKFIDLFGADTESTAMEWLFNFLLKDTKKYRAMGRRTKEEWHAGKYISSRSTTFFEDAEWILTLFPTREAEAREILYQDFMDTADKDPSHPFSPEQPQSSENLLQFDKLFGSIPGAKECLFEKISNNLPQYLPDCLIPPKNIFFDMGKVTRLFHTIFTKAPEGLMAEPSTWLDQNFSVNGGPKIDANTDPTIDNYALEKLFALSAVILETEKEGATISAPRTMMLNWVLIFLGSSPELQESAIRELISLNEAPESTTTSDASDFDIGAFRDGINRIAAKLTEKILENRGLTIDIDVPSEDEKAAFLKNVQNSVAAACPAGSTNEKLLELLRDAVTISESGFDFKATTALNYFSSFQFQPAKLNTKGAISATLPPCFKADPGRAFVQAFSGDNTRDTSSQDVTNLVLVEEEDQITAIIRNKYGNKVMTVSAPKASVIRCSVDGTRQTIFFPAFKLSGKLSTTNSNPVYRAFIPARKITVESSASVDVSYLGAHSKAKESVGASKGLSLSRQSEAVIFCENVRTITYHPQTEEPMIDSFYKDFSKLDPTDAPTPGTCKTITLVLNSTAAPGAEKTTGTPGAGAAGTAYATGPSGASGVKISWPPRRAAGASAPTGTLVAGAGAGAAGTAYATGPSGASAAVKISWPLGRAAGASAPTGTLVAGGGAASPSGAGTTPFASTDARAPGPQAPGATPQ